MERAERTDMCSSCGAEQNETGVYVQAWEEFKLERGERADASHGWGIERSQEIVAELAHFAQLRGGLSQAERVEPHLAKASQSSG